MLLIIGLVRPKAVWPGKVAKCGRVVLLYLSIMVAAFMLLGLLSSSSSSSTPPVAEPPSPTPARHSTVPPQSTTAPASSSTAAVLHATFNVNKESTPVQNVLNFVSGKDQYDIADQVEGAMGLCSWFGSYTMPGMVSVKPGPHESSFVTWTLPDKNPSPSPSPSPSSSSSASPSPSPSASAVVAQDGIATFVFKISQDGSTLWAWNNNAEQIFTVGDAEVSTCSP